VCVIALACCHERGTRVLRRQRFTSKGLYFLKRVYLSKYYRRGSVGAQCARREGSWWGTQRERERFVERDGDREKDWTLQDPQGERERIFIDTHEVTERARET